MLATLFDVLFEERRRYNGPPEASDWKLDPSGVAWVSLTTSEVDERSHWASSMENYNCHITINNRTSAHLIYSKHDLAWGKFAQGSEPVRDIPPKTIVKAFVAQGAVGLAGVEGTVEYKFQDDANITIAIYFDVPTRPLSHNTVRATSSNSDVASTVEGLSGSGASESCIIKVVDGR